MSTNLILVGADKGGVGKTTVSRALLDYLATKGVSFRAFDTEIDSTAGLRRFRPEARVADVGDPRGQMEILDGITDDVPTVVDVRAGMLTPTIQALTDTGLLTEARYGTLRLVVLHVLGATAASVEEVAAITRVIPGSSYVQVRNAVQRDSRWPDMGPNPVMDVPHLSEAAAEAVDKTAQTFVAFATDTNNSRTLRGYVTTWLTRVWDGFDRNKVLG